MIPDLKTSLLDLLYELQYTDVKLIIGGGYGLYLRTEHVRDERTVLQERPEARSTNDLDLFLRPELLIDSNKLRPLSEAIYKLGYQAIPGAEYNQFEKPGPGGAKAGSVKIDFLTGPKSSFEGTKVRTDDRRARPNPSVRLHAHPTNEALNLEKGLMPIMLKGVLSSGEPCQAEVFLPHPFTFLMMKMFAFRDRVEDKNKEFGIYHALDMYIILTTTTEEEWSQALKFRDIYRDEPYIIEAGEIISKYFSDYSSYGILRLKESRYYSSKLQIDDFISVLRELFPVRQ
jgi:hypothetical protein